MTNELLRLVSTGAQKGVKEFKKDGTIVWDVTDKDLKKAGVKKTGYIGGIQRLDNGNTVISIFKGEPQIIELTKDKKMELSQPERTDVCFRYNNSG